MTNAEFLNNYFGTNYNRWMKCRWPYFKDLKVWMIYLDGNVRMRWKNTIDGNKVFEEYVGLEEDKLPEHKSFEENYRLIVDKAQNFKILGVYKYDRLNSNMLKYRIWEKVANSLEEFLQKQGV